MKAEFLQDIATAFETRAELDRKSAEAHELEEERIARFWQGFMECRATVVRPAFEALASYLDQKDIRVQIDEANGAKFKSEIVVPPGESPHSSIGWHPMIQIRWLKGWGLHSYPQDPSQQPYFRIVGDRFKQEVEFSQKTVGEKGEVRTIATTTLEELVEDVISKYLVETVREFLYLPRKKE
jgi:hypothetical protein